MNSNTVEQVGQMLNMLGEKLGPAIDEASQKLGVASEYVFGLFVRQAYVESITWLVILLLLFSISFVMIKVSRKVAEIAEKEGGDDWEFASGASWVLCVASFFSAMITTLCNISTIVTGFINPHYMAIQKLIEMVK